MSQTKSVPPHKREANVDDGHPYGLHAKSTPGCKDSAKVSGRAPFNHPKDSIVIFVLALTAAFLIFGAWLTASYIDAAKAKANVPRPNLFIRLVGVEGLDPRASPPKPPAFHLIVDVDGVSRYYRACSGGGNSMLRVSYHGMILAWGHVPRFCLNGDLLDQSIDGVATVEAKTEGAMLREEVRGLVWSERHILGKAEFDVEGEVVGIGYLHCKVWYFDGKSMNSKASCVAR